MLNDNDQILKDKIFGKLYEKNLNIILCAEPFVKLQFLNNLMDYSNLPIIFLDFDLLYSGYVVSQIIPKNKRIEVFCPDDDELAVMFSKVTKKISEDKCIVILDSLNGFYDICDNKDSGIFINTMIMLLNAIARQKSSTIVVTAIARKKDSAGWILSPEGRQIFELGDRKFFQIDNKGKLTLMTNEDEQIQDRAI